MALLLCGNRLRNYFCDTVRLADSGIVSVPIEAVPDGAVDLQRNPRATEAMERDGADSPVDIASCTLPTRFRPIRFAMYKAESANSNSSAESDGGR